MSDEYEPVEFKKKIKIFKTILKKSNTFPLFSQAATVSPGFCDAVLDRRFVFGASPDGAAAEDIHEGVFILVRSH